MILSGVVRHWPDFFIIRLLLVSNTVVGFWEEHQAGNAIAASRTRGPFWSIRPESNWWPIGSLIPQRSPCWVPTPSMARLTSVARSTRLASVLVGSWQLARRAYCTGFPGHDRRRKGLRGLATLW